MPEMAACMTCGRELSNDEVGLYKKMVNRGATEYLCISCLAGQFECGENLLRQKIEDYRELGCPFFAKR